jgi:hypothetical protein
MYQNQPKSTNLTKLRRKIIQQSDNINIEVKEGLELLDFFKVDLPKTSNFNKSNTFITSLSTNRQYQDNNAYFNKAKRTKFRAEILYFPFLNGELRRTNVKVKKPLRYKFGMFLVL